MAIYDEKINRNTDWGGDASTGYLPVSGRRVQEFVKGELNEKVGKIYRAENGTCYCFANEDTYNEWRYSGGSDDLIVDSFLIESTYDVLVSSITSSNVSVLEGSTGNTLEFNLKIVSKKTGSAADSKARVTFTFDNNKVIKSFQKEYALSNDWTNITENVDDYIALGTNTVTVQIEGLTTMATAPVIYRYDMVNLKYVPTFKYEKAQTANTIEVNYLADCIDTKYLEFYLDGELVKEKQVISPREESSEYINIQALGVGQHSLQTRAYIMTAGGSKFYSELHFFNFAKAGESDPSVLLYVKRPNNETISEGAGLTMTVTQFDSITFNWAMYDYLTRTLDVTFQLGTNIITTVPVATIESDIMEFTFRPLLAGEGQILAVYAKNSRGEDIFRYNIILNVNESSSGIKETTDGMTLKLSAIGRSNGTGCDVWEYSNEMGDTYHTTFNNFAWNTQQGWDESKNALIISDAAYMEVDIQPMLEDWAERGGTLEVDFETYDVEDVNGTIMSIRDEGETAAEIKITASNIFFGTKNGKSVETPYKDGDRMKVAFIGNKKGTAEDCNFLYIVVNGILERAVLFDDYDSVSSTKFLRIGNGEGKAKCRIHSIRAYNRAITIDEAFNNFVIDSDNVQEVYEYNNILRDGTTDIDFDKIANKIPVMIFTGDMPEIYKYGTDKAWRYFDVEYINRTSPTEYNFVSFNCQIKLQGTSSLEYPRKNFKLKTKNSNGTQDEWDKTLYEYDPALKRIKNKRTGKYLDIDETHRAFGTACWTFNNAGEVMKKGKYSFKEGAHKTDKWTLKADYMESSCSHNVGAGKSWNEIFSNVTLIYEPGTDYTDQTYKSDAIVHSGVYKYDRTGVDGVTRHYTIDETKLSDQNKYICRTEAQKTAAVYPEVGEVRTAVDGFPMVCYYRPSHESTELIFMGQYNFLNDKGTQEIYGFEDIKDPAYEDTPQEDLYMVFDGNDTEVWEGLRNTNPLTLFKTMDGWDAGYKDTLDSRWPDPDDEGKSGKRQVNGEAVKELAKWIVSTRHEADTVYSGTIDIDDSFAKRINDYQYGYTNATADSYRYASGTGLEDNAENRQKKFETEKWEHFDVWKLAGYYIYLMRYGAVDQFVKNTMLTTEGNGKYDPRTDKKYRKWYYINYDNDCLFGLRNNGVIAFDWTLDRQTRDDGAVTDSGETSGNTYAMMGHESTLWNNLERDDEFMRMVRDLDYSMSKVGLTYEGMVEAFDTTQTDKWCERIYNANEKYKYIDAAKGVGDMSGAPVNNLWMLQGTRKSHRHWWIANHFNLLNAKWLSGDYKSIYCEIKTNAKAGDKFTMTAGADYYYAWGQRKRIYESNIQLNEGDTYDFVFPTDQTQGDPVVVYAVNKMEELNFSDIIKDMDAGSFDFRIPNTEVQNTLKRFIIGNAGSGMTNTKVTDENAGTWPILTGLEYLDITNYQNLKNIPLTTYKNLHTFKAKGTSLASFAPAEGTRFDLIELPTTITTLDLTDVAFSWNDFKYELNSKLDKLYLSNSKTIGEAYFQRLIKPWLEILNAIPDKTKLKDKEIKLRNLDIALTDLNDLWLFECLRQYSSKHKDSLNITGKIDLYGLQQGFKIEDISRVQALLGERCFEEGNAIYVKAPLSIFMDCTEGDSIVAGQTAHFTSRVYPIDQLGQTITYTIIKRWIDDDGKEHIDPVTEALPYDTVLNSKTGVLTCTERLENISGITIEVECKLVVPGANTQTDYKILTIKEPTYPSYAVLNGDSSIRKDEGEREKIYTIEAKTEEGEAAIGTYEIEWDITGDGIQYLADYGPIAKDKYRILMKSDYEPEISAPLTISSTVSPLIGSAFTESKDILVLNTNVIMTHDTNPTVFAACKRKGWIGDDASAVLKSDVAAVTDEMFGTTFAGLVGDAFGFNEFQYFTSLTKINAGAFANCHITNITIPANITSIEEDAFSDCQGLTGVTFLEGSTINTIQHGTFNNCTALEGMILPSTVTLVENTAFGNTAIRKVWAEGYNATDENGNYKKGLVLPENLREMESCSFENSDTWTGSKTINKLETFTLPAKMEIFPAAALRGYSLENIEVDDDNVGYTSSDGVLYNLRYETLFQYPANKPGSIYTITSTTCSNLAEYSFYNNRNLISMVFPMVVSRCGDHIFEKAENLIEITIPEDSKLSELSSYMFAGCDKLVGINLDGAALVTIGRYAFSDCDGIESFVVPSTIQTIDAYAFSYCRNMTGITMGDNITKLGSRVFYECSSLVDVVLPRFITTNISEAYGAALSSCAALTGVTLPLFVYDKETEEGPVETIVNDTFTTNVLYNGAFILDCPNIREFRAAEGEKGTIFFLKDSVLYKYDNEEVILTYSPWGIEEITMPDDCTIIGPYAFNYNANLKKINVSPNCRIIDSLAFNFAHGVTELTFDRLEMVGNTTFFYANGLSSLTIYNTMKTDPESGELIPDIPVTSDGSFGPTSVFTKRGYGVEVHVPWNMASAYTESDHWSTSTRPSWAPYFTFKPIYLEGDYYVRLFAQNGEEITTASTVVITGRTHGEQILGQYQESKGYRFTFDKVNHRVVFDEPCMIDADGLRLANFRFNEPRGRDYIATGLRGGSSSVIRPTGSTTSAQTVSMTEYKSLLAKVSRLEAVLNNLLDK